MTVSCFFMFPSTQRHDEEDDRLHHVNDSERRCQEERRRSWCQGIFGKEKHVGQNPCWNLQNQQNQGIHEAARSEIKGNRIPDDDRRNRRCKVILIFVSIATVTASTAWVRDSWRGSQMRMQVMQSVMMMPFDWHEGQGKDDDGQRDRCDGRRVHQKPRSCWESIQSNPHVMRSRVSVGFRTNYSNQSDRHQWNSVGCQIK